MSENYNNDIIDNLSTGNTFNNTQVVEFKFEKYVISVKLDESQRFEGITEVKINKDFLESRHKRASSFDVSCYYEE